MRIVRPLILLAALAVPAAARAEGAVTPGAAEGGAATQAAVGMDYAIVSAGLTVARMHADIALGVREYRVHLAYHTAGLVGAFVHGAMDSTVQGYWEADAPVPLQFYSWGDFRGQPRRTLIDYAGGNPEIRSLEPPNTAEREPVPPPLTAHSIDTLTAMAMLIRDIAATGRCTAAATTFDGRRLIRIAATTAGEQVLAPEGGSHFAGPALRCDFEAQQTAGFLQDGDNFSRQPHRGAAWFARIVPDGPPVPVRIRFETRWFGDAVAYLLDAAPEPGRTAN